MLTFDVTVIVDCQQNSLSYLYIFQVKWTEVRFIYVSRKTVVTPARSVLPPPPSSVQVASSSKQQPLYIPAVKCSLQIRVCCLGTQFFLFTAATHFTHLSLSANG